MITYCFPKLKKPDAKSGRHHITIKVSLDDGETWTEKYHCLIDPGSGHGYSYMTKIDDTHFGIIHIGSQADLIFRKISVDKILTQ